MIQEVARLFHLYKKKAMNAFLAKQHGISAIYKIAQLCGLTALQAAVSVIPVFLVFTVEKVTRRVTGGGIGSEYGFKVSEVRDRE